MGVGKPLSPSEPSEPSRSEQLDSWKEIAAYLKRDESTVRRWEKEGLPVHRHVHKKKATVYAYKPEIDVWWKNGCARLESQEAAAAGRPPSLAWWGAAGLVRKGGVAVAVVVVALLVVAAWFFYFRPAPALTESDYVLLADFENTTGDPVFDGTLKQALAVKLGESPFLNIVPEARVRETLQLMQRSPDEAVTGAIAREVCQRQGVKALLEGSIARLGSHYVINLNVQNCQSGEVLARDQVEATRKEEVLSALGQASSRLRGELGESLASIQKYDTPITQATTGSLEALKALGQGDAERAKGGDLPAISFYKRALELDPNFALAHARLGAAYANLGEWELAREYRTKAFALRKRVSGPERFYISAVYYGGVTGEIEKAIETYEMWKRTYPRFTTPYNNLGVLYFQLGQYEKALEAFQEGLRRNPQRAVVLHENVAVAYLFLNRFEESRAQLERTRAQGFDSADLRLYLYWVAFVQGDKEAMRQQVEWARGKLAEPRMVQHEALAAAFAGKAQEARQLFQRSVEMAQRHNFAESAALSAAQEADMEANFGNARRARQRAQAALKLGRGTRAQLTVANALARAGDVRQAEALAEDLAKRFPSDTLLHAVDLPIVRGLVEIERGNPRKAIEVLQPARAYELNPDAGLYANYIRGQAYLKAGMTAEAAAEFQTIVDNRGVVPTSALYPLAHLGLGRAYALAGDIEASRRAYQDFLALWKDADPDIPILQQAQAEYEQLK